jgi:1-acyl-sn-glycerol-3-phosphate acyltransferase
LPLTIEDSYFTPEGIRRPFFDRVFPRMGLYFYLKYIGIVFSQRKISLSGLYDDEAWALSSLDIFRLIEKCGGKFRITGLSNLDKCDGPVVFVSNHMGTLETMVFPFLIVTRMKVTFVVKDSLVEHKLFGPIMRSRNPITVSRKNSREDLVKVLQQGKDLLEKGISVIIFPQSTRQQEFNPQKFNTLGVKLASGSGVKVVPVAVKTDFWGNGKKIKELGPINRDLPIYIDFGDPIEIGGSVKDAHQKVIDHISKNLREWEGK